ncbi:MAG: hypothetical protein EA349_05990 [Halomonadaceae bacterium]|nr:MAG: hypothetical protein EA349_05990 [Halomonadaceae bacterium]
MQTQKTRLASYIAAGLIAGSASAVSTSVVAEPSLDAGIEISNMYLWRGLDLGAPDGSPMIAGSLDVDSGLGFYAGTWAASGDSTAGTELDLYVGYATDLTDDISVDLALVTYMYPSTTRDDEEFGDFGDLSEVILSVSGYGFGVSYYNNIAGLSGYEYVAASYGTGPFGIAVGRHMFDDEAQGGDFGKNMTHVDLSFAFNDEVSFTASTIVDSDLDENVRSSTLLQVVYAKSFSF